jgi:hypothetical protein
VIINIEKGTESFRSGMVLASYHSTFYVPLSAEEVHYRHQCTNAKSPGIGERTGTYQSPADNVDLLLIGLAF